MTGSAVIYVRQSLDRTGEGMAVARQEKECRELCKKLGLRVQRVYADNDVSATSGVARPAFDAMLGSEPVAIVAWHQDRLLRLSRDLERVIALDIPIYTVTAGTLDLSTPAGRAVARTVAAWSQYETEQKATRQKAAHRQRAADGRPWTTRRPFGFEDDAVTHRKAERDAIRRMYDDALAGVSQAEIARRLNAEGIASSLGKPWRQGTVRALLMNPRNAGLRAHRGVIVGPGTWKPIVSEDVWRATVARLTASTHAGKGRRSRLLSSLAVCGVCRAVVRVSNTVAGERIYVCSAKSCVGRSADRVDELVVETVVARLTRADAADLIASRDKAEVAALRQEAHAAREALDTLAEMFAAGELTAPSFRAGTRKATERLQAVEADLARSAGESPVAVLVSAKDVRAAWESLDLARQRGVVDALMTVHIDRTVRGARFIPEDVRIEWKVAR